MKTLFITGIYPTECLSELQSTSKIALQNAPNVFQWAVIDGFTKNLSDLTVACCSFLPSFPLGYKKPHTPSCEMRYNGLKIGDCLSYCNLAIYKQKSIEKALYRYCKEWCEKNKGEDKLYILTYTSWPEHILPVVRLKKEYPNIVLASIITDLIDDAMNFASNRSLLKRFQVAYQFKTIHRTYKEIDKFILLSKAMEEKIPEAIGKSIVVEGIYALNSNESFTTSSDKGLRFLTYTGSLQGFVGINELVDAFMQTSNQNFRLIICGGGESSGYIEEKSQEDSRIVFKGWVDRKEALAIQQESTALVNPRKPNGGITKYSFPSKTMEYLASGIPMIGYRLEGIPDEYFEHMYIPADLSIEAMAKTIGDVISSPQDVLECKAATARNFILNNKTSKMQVERILNFMQE